MCMRAHTIPMYMYDICIHCVSVADAQVKCLLVSSELSEDKITQYVVVSEILSSLFHCVTPSMIVISLKVVLSVSLKKSVCSICSR